MVYKSTWLLQQWKQFFVSPTFHPAYFTLQDAKLRLLQNKNILITKNKHWDKTHPADNGPILVVRYSGISLRIVFFQSARSGSDCPWWINTFDRYDCRPASPRKCDQLLFLNMLKNSSRSNTVVPWSSWSSEDLVRLGYLHSVCTTHEPR